MTDNSLFNEILQDVRTLAQKTAKGRPPRLSLSPEIIRRLGEIGPHEETPANLTATTSTVEPLPSPVKSTITPEIPPAAAQEVLEDSLDHIAAEIRRCTQCGLHETRTHTVPGEGNAHAEIVFVGEAPGADEDAQGRPFVGRAGLLLTDIIVKGMRFSREDVFICNVLKCRPPENRTPSPDEVFCCEPYLIRQLALLRPKVICALGGTAAQTLLKTTALVGKLRGKWHTYHGIPLRVTYHPAYLLRNEADKRKAWEDVKEILKLLRGEITPSP